MSTSTASERVEITPELLDAISQAAGAATPDEWKRESTHIYSRRGNVASCGNPNASTIVGYTPTTIYEDGGLDAAVANADYLLTAQPRVVLALVERIRELESENAKLWETLEIYERDAE